MKKCAKCGAEKPRTEFYVRKASKDGLSRLCKICDKKESRQWALDNPERKKEISNRWVRRHPEQAAASTLKWQRENPDKVAAKYNRWAKAHPEAASAWARNHPEEAKEKDRRWKRAHPDVVLANYNKRRAAKIRACPPWADLDAIKEIYKEARRLTKETGVKHHVDHEYPLRGKGFNGLHVEWNLRVIPAIENLRKGNRLPPDSGVGVVLMVST